MSTWTAEEEKRSHWEIKYLGICICVSSSWVFLCLEEPLIGLKYCKIWSSCSIPTIQGVKHPEQNRSYIISASQSAPWGTGEKHKHSYKGSENACNTDASAEFQSSFLRGTCGQTLWPPWLGRAAVPGWVSCKGSTLNSGDSVLSPIQTAGTGLCACWQVHGPWLEVITLLGCTRELGTSSLSFTCSSFSTTWIQEGAVVRAGAITNTSKWAHCDGLCHPRALRVSH